MQMKRGATIIEIVGLLRLEELSVPLYHNSCKFPLMFHTSELGHVGFGPTVHVQMHKGSNTLPLSCGRSMFFKPNANKSTGKHVAD